MNDLQNQQQQYTTQTQTKEFRLKSGEKFLEMIHGFSATEKVIFGLLTLIALVSAIGMAWKVNKSFLVPTPAYGGSFSEGIVGLPRSINPVLAFTDVDRDISHLVYSGLTKHEDGKIVPDLAEDFTISDDGLTYTFHLKEDLRFHDGTLLTTDDVEFTIQKIQDGLIKSPRRADWASVTINKVSPTEIKFILKQPYSPFLTNTTIGIIPAHIWKNVDVDQFIYSQYNVEPIGSGPYEIDRIIKNKEGIPQEYRLVAFDDYQDQKAYISRINLHFYPNEEVALEAYMAGDVMNFAGISPREASSLSSVSNEYRMIRSPLPRIFGVFFNQNHEPMLANKEVRQALDLALNKDRIVEEVLYGYGVSINSPIPLGTLEGTSTTMTGDKEAAKDLLARNDWVINAEGVLENDSGQVLEFSIATIDSPDLKQAAEIIKSEWESIGAKVNVDVYEYGDLSQNIIKTRKYDALLFGEVIGKDLDLYAFWHSSQRNSPGLNVSMYVNSRVDSLLEEARVTTNEEEKDEIYRKFEEVIQEEVPAVFIYSPEYMYLISNKIHGFDLKSITNPSDRFHNIDKWYIATDYVWKVFINN